MQYLKKLIFVSVIFLVSCGSNDLSSIINLSDIKETSTNNNSSYNSTFIDNGWREQEIEDMLDLFQQTIPFAPMSNNYVFDIGFDDEYQCPYIFVFDEEIGNINQAYKAVLIANNYIFEEELEGYFCYTLPVIDDEIVLYHSYFDNTFYIEAYYTYSPTKIIDNWRPDLLAQMNVMFNEALPVAPMTINYQYETYNDEGATLWIHDDYCGDIKNVYIQELEKNDYIFDADNAEYPGYSYYKKILTPSSTIMVMIGFDIDGGYFEINAWLEGNALAIDNTLIINTSYFVAGGYEVNNARSPMTIDNVEIAFFAVALQADAIQVKKTEGYIINNTSLNLKQIVFTSVDGTGAINVLVGDSPSSLSLVSENAPGIYNITSGSYFKIMTNTAGWVSFMQVAIVYQ